jgi:ABC-type lipoprotein release transport system permease subunit
MTWKLALRHLSRHWRLNLVLLSIMILGAALLASLPMLAIAIAGESLTQSLDSAPIDVRNIIVIGKSKTDDLPEEIHLSLGEMVKETIAVREGDIVGFPIITKPDGEQLNLYPATLILDLRSFDRLEERVRVLEGRLPEPEPVFENDDTASTYETAIGVDAARRSGIGLGDEVSPAGGSYRLQIVGIVEPLHPNSEAWWGDSHLLPFSAWRRISISPDIDEWNISFLVHPKTMVSRIQHNQYWRIILNHDEITAANAPSVRETLIGLQSSLSEEDLVVRTGLVDLIAQFEQSLALARVSLLLLTFQSLLAVFFLVGMFGIFLVEGSQTELAILSGRGFSRGQITSLFARGSILLALLAASVSPWVGRWSLSLWARWRGVPSPDIIPSESWWLALATGLFSWITLVVSVYRATRREKLTGQGRGMRLETDALTHRHPIWDFFILTLGGLAYWQLVQGGTITREMNEFSESTVTGISDPVLLLGPTLLLLAVGLILIRLLPLLWRLLSWVSRQAQGSLLPLGFSRLARQPVGPSQVTLLISLTAGLTFFASAFTHSIEIWQQNMARYLVGADIRFRQPLLDHLDVNNLADPPGVTGITQVIRVQATFLINEYQRLDFDLLAVDRNTFPSVVSFPPGISSYSIGQILNVLQSDSPDLLPVVVSNNIHTRNLDIGDQITLEMGGETYPSEVIGIIVNFPLIDDVFAITDLSQFVRQVDLEAMALTDQGTRETWLAVDPDEHENLITKLTEAGFGDSIVGNSLTQLEVLQNNLIFREVTTAFELNALVLIPLSVVGYTLIQLFATQRRGAEFIILQVLGFSKSQIRGVLLLEGFVLLVLGILIGTGIGYGLSTLMEPFLTHILPPLGDGFVLSRILFDWPEMSIRYIALVGLYGIGLLVLMMSAIRNLRSAQF